MLSTAVFNSLPGFKVDHLLAEPFTSVTQKWLFVLSPVRWKPFERRLELTGGRQGISDLARVAWSCTPFHSG